MARHGQVLPPVPAPGKNTLCRAVLLSIASPGLPLTALSQGGAIPLVPAATG
jgi:hypothetical protein